MLSFLGMLFDTASGLAVGSGTGSSFHREDGAGDVFEAHNLTLIARGRVAFRRSVDRGSVVDTASRGLGQANVWRTAALRLRVDSGAYVFQNRVRDLQMRTRPSVQEVARVVTPPLARAGRSAAVGQQPASQAGLEAFQKERPTLGAPSFPASQRGQGFSQMGDLEPMFMERWHYTVPPHVCGPVFALQRDPNSGETREPGVRVNQWEISAAPEQ
jgi:hypothetical protein